MNYKNVNFEFRDIDGNIYFKDSITILHGMNWLDVDKLLADMISRYTGKNETVSGNILGNEWMTQKKFPDGSHFFINYDNEFGFVSSYLYQIENGKD